MKKSAYLDTSSLVKRYISERGSEVLDSVYERSEAGELRIAFSIWNIGEAIGVFDRYREKKFLTDAEYKQAQTNLMSESLKMSRLDALIVHPITASAIAESWTLVVKHHIYEADALQISTCKEVGCNLFLGADKRLITVASAEEMKALNVESEQDEALNEILNASG